MMAKIRPSCNTGILPVLLGRVISGENKGLADTEAYGHVVALGEGDVAGHPAVQVQGPAVEVAEMKMDEGAAAQHSGGHDPADVEVGLPFAASTIDSAISNRPL